MVMRIWRLALFDDVVLGEGGEAVGDDLDW